MWPVVNECCDNGCWLVVLVRCLATGRIIAYCRDCGAAWLSRADLDRGSFVIGSRTCSQGVAIPTREEVAASAWADAVREYVQESEFSAASEINDQLTQQREGRPPNLAPQRTRPAAALLRIVKRLLGGPVR